jgi:signal transduction histidine kinase/DNA-binding response OmpR family regulator
VNPHFPSLKSVRHKLLVGILFTTMAALMVSGASLFIYDLRTYRQSTAAELSMQAELMGYSTTAALQFDDRVVARQNLAFLQARPTIRMAAIYDVEGRLFATYLRAGVEDSVPTMAPGDGGRINGDQLEVMRPIASGSDRLGAVYLQADLHMGHRIASFAAMAVLVTIAALVVAVLLSQWVQAGVTGPITEMSDVARTVVATRDYTLRASKKSDDEIGTLADAFNEMLAEIQRRTVALEQSRDEVGRLNADLEERVKHRTAELEESNLRLQAADAAKSRFLSMMSHEIRTPMNGVLGMLELLSLTPLDGQQKSTLEVVRESGRSLLRIIDDILDFSKIEAGKLEVIPQVASIPRIVADVVGIYAGNASSKSLTLKSHSDPRISPAVLVDATRLQQVLNNLVSNAIKFTTEGFVELRAELLCHEGNREVVRFTVKDTGIGVSGEAQAGLFQPFAQAGGATSRSFGGTGLGLSIAQRLANLMGGHISMQSAPGRGTTMTLDLPLPVADPDALSDDSRRTASRDLQAASLQRRNAPSTEEAAAEGTLVLAVDDHPINRLVLMRQVTLLGYACDTASDGREALEKWRSGLYRTVITDCNMPEMDGYELARAIRKEESSGRCPRTLVIACTANALRGDAENCFAAGMDDYIAKPVEIAKLMAKLDYWLPIANRAATGPVAHDTAVDNAVAAPIEAAVLDEVCGGDAEVRHQALMHFGAANAEDSRVLSHAMEIRDLAEIRRISHRIRGAAATIGANALAQVCERLEEAAKASDWRVVLDSQQDFQREAGRVNAYIPILVAG